MSQSCCRGVLRTSPVKAIRAATQKAQKHAIPVRVGSLRAGNGTVSSGTPWSSGPWRSEPKATDRDPRATPNLPEKSLSGNAWAEWRHRANPADSPAAELLSEHCFAENALRVMCLTRGSARSAPGSRPSWLEGFRDSWASLLSASSAPSQKNPSGTNISHVAVCRLCRA